jgi:hypothetical protein
MTAVRLSNPPANSLFRAGFNLCLLGTAADADADDGVRVDSIDFLAQIAIGMAAQETQRLSSSPITSCQAA